MLELILTIALVGFVVYLIVTYIPMPPGFSTVIIVLTVVLLVYYVARLFGLADLPLPRGR